MSSKARWRETFQKTRSLSQTSLGNVNEVKRKTSLLEEGDLSLSDDELEEYLGTIKKKSGLNRLWKGNTFDRVIDRTPDVSISSVSTDKEVPIEEDKTANSDNDFLPNIMALPSVATEDNNTDISEPSSIKPFQTVNLMSDLELSEAPLEITNNVKLALSEPESVDVIDKEIKSIGDDISDVEEVQTLDEISEVIEDLSHVSKQSTNSSYSKHRSHQPKDRQSSRRSQQSTDNETDQSFQKSSQRNSQNKRRSKSRSESKHSTRSSTKSKHSSQHASEHSSLDTSRKQTKSHSRHSKAESSGKSDVSSKISEDSYTADFSESSKQTESSRGRGSTSSGTSSARSSTKRTKLKSIEEISKKTSKHRMNQCYHDVATQVNMDDVNRQKLGVGMATLGPSFGHHYVDPSPIARHVVNADALEAVTAYNPAVVALTDMLRQQLRLVEQFVDNSRRMYESYTNNLNTTYRYTTLEDTLQYIDENRDRHNSSDAATKK